MLYRIHVWAAGWPVHSVNIFTFKTFIHQVGSMRTCIIVHEDEVWADFGSKSRTSCLHIWAVTVTPEKTFRFVRLLNTPVFHYTKLISFPGSKMCSDFSPDEYVTGVILQTESGLVFIQGPMVLTPPAWRPAALSVWYRICWETRDAAASLEDSCLARIIRFHHAVQARYQSCCGGVNPGQPCTRLWWKSHASPSLKPKNDTNLQLLRINLMIFSFKNQIQLMIFV